MATRTKPDNKKSRTGRLRIVAGKWRSRLLEIAAVPGLRPTSVRVRETLFNWLSPDITGARCLDLCAGTGALGLEALSRGAAVVNFVETSSQAIKTLQRNIASLGAEGAVIHCVDAASYLSGSVAEPFDIVFLDPPFAADMLDDLCRLLAEGSWLASKARIYLEMNKNQSLPELPKDWRILKDKSAGNVRYILATPQRSA